MRDQIPLATSTDLPGPTLDGRPPVEREGAWSAPGTRTRSAWGTDPAERDSGTFRCVLHGEIDFACREELATVARVFATSRHRDAEVDVSDVTFVDSSALALLLGMRRVAADRGGRVVLVGPGRRLRRLLSIAGVSPLFGVDQRLPVE